jgi:hypothetical protein
MGAVGFMGIVEDDATSPLDSPDDPFGGMVGEVNIYLVEWESE